MYLTADAEDDRVGSDVGGGVDAATAVGASKLLEVAKLGVVWDVRTRVENCLNPEETSAMVLAKFAIMVSWVLLYESFVKLAQ